jgi:hypothetical protein
MSTQRSRHLRRLGLAALALTAMLGLDTAFARPRASVPWVPLEAPAAFPAQRGGGISLAQATAMAQSRYRGQVVKAETVMNGDRVIHVIRILGDDGRVRTVRIDAKSGSFL